NYQNNDPLLLSLTPSYTLLQLDGTNNQLQLPTDGTQIVFSDDTNLYRASAGVLKTDDNIIIDGLTPNRAVVTDSNNQLVSSITTSAEIDNVSGTTSPIQTQLNNKVTKTGDTMTGALQLPAGSASS